MTKKHFYTAVKYIILKLPMHICPRKALTKIQNVTKKYTFFFH